MHPRRLRAVPVRQYAAAEDVRLRVVRRCLAYAFQVSDIHPMVVVDEGDPFRSQERDGAVQRMRLSHPRLGDPAQRQSVPPRRRVRRGAGIEIEQGMRAVGARVGGDEHVDGPIAGMPRLVQVAQGAVEQSGTVVRADQDGERRSHRQRQARYAHARFLAGLAVACHRAEEMTDGHELAEGVVGPASREQPEVPARRRGSVADRGTTEPRARGGGTVAAS